MGWSDDKLPQMLRTQLELSPTMKIKTSSGGFPDGKMAHFFYSPQVQQE